jgi:hypothetical protein
LPDDIERRENHEYDSGLYRRGKNHTGHTFRSEKADSPLKDVAVYDPNPHALVLISDLFPEAACYDRIRYSGIKGICVPSRSSPGHERHPLDSQRFTEG